METLVAGEAASAVTSLDLRNNNLSTLPLELHRLEQLHGGRGVTERSVHPPQQQPCLWPADPCTPRHQGVGQRAMVFVQGHALLRTLEARLGRVSLVDGLVEQLPRLGIGSR